MSAASLSSRPAGRLTARYLKSLIVARGDAEAAAAFCGAQRWVDSDELVRLHKTAVGANTLVDLSSVQRTLAHDLAALVQPLSIIGRLQGFRRIPPAVNCIQETGQTSAFWGTQGAPIPLSSPAYSRTQLAEQRCSAITVVTRELAEVSSPSAEEAIATDLANAIVRKLDATFIDPFNAGSPEEQPASITRLAPQFTSTGTAVANIDADLRLLLNSLSDGGSDLTSAAWVLHPRSGAYLASLRGSGGSPCYPGIGALGGTLLGLPAITSGSITRSGSPQETSLFLVDPARVWLVDEQRMTVDTTRAAALEMSDVPANDSSTGTGASVVSLWQTESIAIKAVRYINWRAVSSSSAAAVLTRVNF